MCVRAAYMYYVYSEGEGVGFGPWPGVERQVSSSCYNRVEIGVINCIILYARRTDDGCRSISFKILSRMFINDNRPMCSCPSTTLF